MGQSAQNWRNWWRNILVLRRFYHSFRTWQVNFNSSFGTDISTRKGRRLAWLHTHLVDHAWIRLIWTNMYLIAPGVWRSNQPGPSRFHRLQALGVRSIINLRGPSAFAVYLFEQESCAKHDIALYNNTIGAFSLYNAQDYLGLLTLFDQVEKPLVFHCKSGADRAGLAAALYLIDQQGATVEQALAQLDLKYAHRKGSKAGILGHFLETYASDNAATPISIRRWLETRYDRDATVQSFHAQRKKRA